MRPYARIALPAVISCTLFLAALVPGRSEAQTQEFPVACSQAGPPLGGDWPIYHNLRWWYFVLNVADRSASYLETLWFEPNPALSINTNWMGLAKLLWTDPSVVASCWDRRTQLPDQRVLVQVVHRIEDKFGSFAYRWFDESCNEMITDDYDEFTPEPPSGCADYGSGGSGEATSDPDPGGVIDWQFLCDQLDLENGYWDIVVDGIWTDTIYCT